MQCSGCDPLGRLADANARKLPYRTLVVMGVRATDGV